MGRSLERFLLFAVFKNPYLWNEIATFLHQSVQPSQREKCLSTLFRSGPNESGRPTVVGPLHVLLDAWRGLQGHLQARL